MKKGNFQIIIVVVFIVLAVFGVLVFSGAIPLGSSGGTGSLGTVVLWGTIKNETINPLIQEFNTANPTLVVKYEEKSADTFDQDLLEALASGTGPDMFFLSDSLAFHYANKVYAIPYQSYPVATFKNTFAGAGEVFLTSRGVLAIPIYIDPLMMYYNRSILDANSVVNPPAYWDDLSLMVPTLNKKDDSNKIIKSAVALGQFSNVSNAKDILATLFMQLGNPIVSEKNGTFIPTISNVTNPNSSPIPAVRFYTGFADPNQSNYSWNKSFSNSRDAFSAENLAFYFGFSSELNSLVNRNPNQNFFVAPVPQIKGANFKLTDAHVTGIAILASSKNPTAALTASSLLATSSFASKLSSALGVVPARRDLLATKPLDAYSPIFYNSALFSRSWMDPGATSTNDIFRNMIDNILANNLTIDAAISDAASKMNLLLVK